MARPRRRTVQIAFLCGSAAVALLWLARPRPVLLSSFATRYRMYGGAVVPGDPGHRAWLNTREHFILYWRGVPLAGAWRNPSFRSVPEAGRVDPVAPSRTVLQPLSRLLQREELNGRTALYSLWSISPDSRWIAQIEGASPTWLALAALDGSRIVRWKLDRFGRDRIVWMPDSRRLLLFDVPPIQTPDPTALYTIPAAGAAAAAPVSVPIAPLTFVESPLGITSRGTVLVAQPKSFSQPYDRMGICQREVFRGGADQHSAIIYPPIAGGTIADLSLSRRGDRLAWLFKVRTGVANGRLVQSFLGWFGVKPQDMVLLCLSDLDGSNMRELGRAPCAAKPLFCGALDWATDDRHLSFVLDWKLWLVPVR